MIPESFSESTRSKKFRRKTKDSLSSRNKHNWKIEGDMKILEQQKLVAYLSIPIALLLE